MTRASGAGLDVFEQEPPLEDHPLFALDNVILSPHSAGPSKEAAIRMAVSTAKNVLAGIDGKLDPARCCEASISVVGMTGCMAVAPLCSVRQIGGAHATRRGRTKPPVLP